jgi:hypothetical protein
MKANELKPHDVIRHRDIPTAVAVVVDDAELGRCLYRTGDPPNRVPIGLFDLSDWQLLTPAPQLGPAVDRDNLECHQTYYIDVGLPNLVHGVTNGVGLLISNANRNMIRGVYKNPYPCPLSPLPAAPAEKPCIEQRLVEILVRHGFCKKEADHAGAIRELRDLIQSESHPSPGGTGGVR